MPRLARQPDDRQVNHSVHDHPGTPLPRWLLGGLTALSAAYVVAGALWSRTDLGFPFGPGHDPTGEDQSPLGSVDHGTAWPYVLALSSIGVVVSLALASMRMRSSLSTLLTGAAATQGVICAVIIPDGRPLVAAAHVPVLLVGKPFGWPPGVTIGSQLPWPVVHQLILMAAGAAWLIVALLNFRVSRRACLRCGRTSSVRAWSQPAAALRWGRWAVYVAVAAPAAYASSRIAWAFGIPYGVSRDWLVRMEADEPTIFTGGAMIASLGLGGALLTFGLVARWGERWPSWVPRLRGTHIRPAAAVVPSLVVATLLISAGKGWYVSAVAGHLPERVFGENWATVIFGATLPVWGLALAAAGYAYWLRRRGPCPRCAR
jgi:hypothetical protein